MHLLSLLTGFFALVLISHAQESGEANRVDYGPAFERLIKLGLPDAKGASYVKLTLHGGEEDDYYGGYSGNRFPKRDGDAWLLPDGKEGQATLIHRFYENISVVKKKKRGGLMRALVGKAKTPEGAGALGDWKPVDVSKDTEKIIKGLDDLVNAGRAFNAERWGYDTSASHMPSKVLVMACHMYRAGHKKEGNQLAQKILSISPNPTQVIDNIVNELADRQYENLAASFFKTKDWKAYHEGIEALIKRYPRGWNTRLGAQILLPKIQQRVKGEKAQLSTFKGITIKPEAIKILDDLLTKTEPIIVAPTPFWLLIDPSKKQNDNSSGYSRRSAPAAEWMKKLCAMGMDGFVALAAAAADESLLATSMQSGGGDYYSRSYYSGGSESLDQQALNAYASMERPCTRGEIARKILISTMPDADSDLAQKSPEELRDIAYQWWLAHRGDSKSELARHIMEAGNSQARQVAVLSLIQSGKDEDAKLVEEFIMGADDLSDSIRLLEPYLKARKGKAKKFYEGYAKMVKEIVASGDESSLPWNMRQQGGVDKFLKRLSVYVDDVSVDKVLADIKSGKTPIKDGLAMLDAAASGEDTLKYIPILVSLATEKEELTDRAAILQKLVQLSYNAQRGAADDQEEEQRKKSIASLLASKADWEKLLTLTASPKGKEEEAALNQLPSISVYAAWCVEMIYFPEHTGLLQQISFVIGRDKMNEFIVQHAKNLLGDPEGVELPDPKNVDEKRLATIRGDLANLTSLEVMEYYEKLPIQEKLAWTNVLAGYEDGLPDGVAGLSKLIVTVSWANTSTADAAYKKQITDLTKNKEFSKKLVDSFIELLAKDPEKYANYMFFIQSPGQAGHGMTLNVWEGARGQSWKSGLITTGAGLIKDGKVTSMAGIGTYHENNWIIGSKYAPSKDAPDESENIKKVIETALENISAGSRFNVIFFTETAAHLKKLAEEKDSTRLLPAP